MSEGNQSKLLSIGNGSPDKSGTLLAIKGFFQDRRSRRSSFRRVKRAGDVRKCQDYVVFVSTTRQRLFECLW